MTVKEESLAHYDRMIPWAEKQDPNEPAIRGKMLVDLGEHWGGEFCPYCKRSACGCQDCQLNNESCCAGLWPRMARSKTWGEWIPAAKCVRQYIEEHG